MAEIAGCSSSGIRIGCGVCGSLGWSVAAAKELEGSGAHLLMYALRLRKSLEEMLSRGVMVDGRLTGIRIVVQALYVGCRGGGL